MRKNINTTAQRQIDIPVERTAVAQLFRVFGTSLSLIVERLSKLSWYLLQAIDSICRLAPQAVPQGVAGGTGHLVMAGNASGNVPSLGTDRVSRTRSIG